MLALDPFKAYSGAPPHPSHLCILQLTNPSVSLCHAMRVLGCFSCTIPSTDHLFGLLAQLQRYLLCLLYLDSPVAGLTVALSRLHCSKAKCPTCKPFPGLRVGAWNKVPECLSSERSEVRGQAAQGAESGSKDRGTPTLVPKSGSDHYSSEGPSAHSPGAVTC